ncbi:hypothetical protein Vretimale_19929 [Volvox reticuliferus]|uniref:HAT C-terminal dimerisation domain-containing protein n=2 Tax=Volvox reticuliferus TaxID=1737510 RepID=A0A8J4M103_9CHLO|nr:hypothetical protein Vretimale_19929 [Volvox reticuliferus]
MLCITFLLFTAAKPSPANGQSSSAAAGPPPPKSADEVIDLAGDDEKARKKPKIPVSEHTQSKYAQAFPWFINTGRRTHAGHCIGGCSVCKQHNPNGQAKAFIRCTAVVTDANDLKAHDGSVCHAQAVNRARAVAGQGPMDVGLQRSVQKAAAAVSSIVQLLVLCVLWMVKEHVPMLKLPSMLAMMAVAGVAGVNHKYNHYRYFIMALRALSEVILAAQIQRALESPYFSIMSDSSTDVSGEDHILLYIRYMDMASFASVTEYLCAVRCTLKTAEGIVAVTEAVLATLHLDPQKMVGYGCDGASVYLGRHNGVAAKFREKLSFLLAVHCVAHRTALVMGDATRDLPELPKIDALLKSIHSLFNKSSKMQGKWEAFAKMHGCTRLKFPIYNATRWFSRMQCVIVLICNAHTLLLFLEKYQAAWPQAKAVYKQLSDVQALARLFVLRDLLGPCESLSKAFQSDGLKAHEIYQRVENAKAALEQRGSSPMMGQAFLSFKAALTKSMIWTVGGKSVKLKGNINTAALRTLALKFVSCVVEHLDDRFADAKLLRAFHIFDPETYRDMSDDEMRSYGKQELMDLLIHFCSKKNPRRLFEFERVDLPNLQEEFLHLKVRLKWQLTIGRSSWQAAWAGMCKEAHLFPRLLLLVYVATVLPTQTACVERGFSRHRIIKNRLTNRLMIPTVDSLLRVGLLGPPADMAAKTLIEEAACIHETQGYKGKLHALFDGASAVQLIPFGDESGEVEDADEAQLVYPASDDEAFTESDYESADDGEEVEEEEKLEVEEKEAEGEMAGEAGFSTAELLALGFE